MIRVIAYSLRNGVIHISGSMPADALPLLSGPTTQVNDLIKLTADYRDYNQLPQVPGMQAAPTVDAKLKALRDYRQQLSERISTAVRSGRQLSVSVTFP